jgi:hypothetical protein
MYADVSQNRFEVACTHTSSFIRKIQVPSIFFLSNYKYMPVMPSFDQYTWLQRLILNHNSHFLYIVILSKKWDTAYTGKM